jgi:hypothetical protein
MYITCVKVPEGRSTGLTTPDGMARTLATMKAGLVRWLAQFERAVSESAVRTVAGWKIMHGGRRARMPGWAIGLRKNWRTCNGAKKIENHAHSVALFAM